MKLRTDSSEEAENQIKGPTVEELNEVGCCQLFEPAIEKKAAIGNRSHLRLVVWHLRNCEMSVNVITYTERIPLFHLKLLRMLKLTR